ncbi:MAG: hypothetical protein ACK5TS_12775 [Betaproteobacteria bacterium]
MVTSADEARQRAAKAAALLRLVNEAPAAPLVKASDAGETSARIDFEPIQVPARGAARGRLYDQALVDLLEAEKFDVLAQGCRRFMALGFSVSSVLQDESAGRTDNLYSNSPYVILSHLVLDYSRAAAPATRELGSATIQANVVALPAAHHWRARAESAHAIKQHEARALARIAEHAEQGASRCLVSWKELTRDDPMAPEKMVRLADMLRTRGFGVEISESTLRVRW